MSSNKVRVAALYVMLWTTISIPILFAICAVLSIQSRKEAESVERIHQYEAERTRAYAAAAEISKRNAEIRAGVAQANKGRVRWKARPIPEEPGESTTNDVKR